MKNGSPLSTLTLLGVALITIGDVTAIGCSSSDLHDITYINETAGPGGATSTGTGGAGIATGGQTSAGAGPGGSSGIGAGGAGSSTGIYSDAAHSISLALGQGAPCEVCISSLTGNVSAAGQDFFCTGIADKCDLDQACLNLIATTSAVHSTRPDSTPTCWFGKADELMAENATMISDTFYACIVFGPCASVCGGLTNSTDGCP